MNIYEFFNVFNGSFIKLLVFSLQCWNFLPLTCFYPILLPTPLFSSTPTTHPHSGVSPFFRSFHIFLPLLFPSIPFVPRPLFLCLSLRSACLLIPVSFSLLPWRLLGPLLWRQVSWTSPPFLALRLAVVPLPLLRTCPLPALTVCACLPSTLPTPLPNVFLLFLKSMPLYSVLCSYFYIMLFFLFISLFFTFCMYILVFNLFILIFNLFKYIYF